MKSERGGEHRRNYVGKVSKLGRWMQDAGSQGAALI